MLSLLKARAQSIERVIPHIGQGQKHDRARRDGGEDIGPLFLRREVGRGEEVDAQEGQGYRDREGDGEGQGGHGREHSVGRIEVEDMYRARCVVWMPGICCTGTMMR